MPDLPTSGVFTATSSIEEVTVDYSGYYDITADGAQGGAGGVNDQTFGGGLGATASAEIYLVAGEELQVVVGGEGGSGANGQGGGGGGGSFVILTQPYGSSVPDTNLIVAGGGGGGGGFGGGQGGNTGPNGGNGVDPFNSGLIEGTGGKNGAAGGGYGGAGGGGYTGGAAGAAGQPGKTAGTSYQGSGNGGIGGGGAGASEGAGGEGGGGGGYGGGGAGSGGGGGGSFVAAGAIDDQQTAGSHSGAGSVTFAYVDQPPGISGAGGTTFTDAGATTDTPFTGVTIADTNPGSPMDTVTLTLSDKNATLEVGASQPAGVSFSRTGATTYTLTGSAANVTSELDALTLQAPATLTGASNGVEALNLAISATSSVGDKTSSGAVTADIYAPSFTRTFAYTGDIETFTAPVSGYYDIAASGAKGGASTQGGAGGLGAMASGDVYLAAGAQLEIVVGGMGGSDFVGGGGGGSFVIETNNGQTAVDVNEVIAGGGGGAYVSNNGGGGRTQGTGGAGTLYPNYPGAPGGVDGAGGSGARPHGYAAGGGGGGGFTGGAGGGPSQNGLANGTTFAGGAGPSQTSPLPNGGFGGGGGGDNANGGYGGGGGGGFGGGGGGSSGGGGGGGSFVNAAATDVVKVAATHSGNGAVTIVHYAASLTDSAGVTTNYDTFAAALQAADADTPTTSSIDTLTVLGDIVETANLPAIEMASGLSLTIDGNGLTLDGAGAYRGLYVLSGDVSVENLTIKDARAVGGAGSDGGGGAAGLGGGLYIADDSADGLAPASVTLSNVAFINNRATGGAGGAGQGGSGGGGGQGGAGHGASGGDSFTGLAGGGSGGAGGYGAGGGGGNPGGAGGFAGGGGAGGGGAGTGGAGGFGGGGGGIGTGENATGGAGAGGFGAGAGEAGSYGGGGGGLGAGGDIFLQGGASLTIETASSLGVGAVAGGSGGAGFLGSAGGDGAAYGDGLFIQGGTAMAPSLVYLGAGQISTQTTTVSGDIADVVGSGGTSGTGGSNGRGGTGALVIEGAGTVDLAADNTFEGGITIDSGTLELSHAGAAGTGAITFAATVDPTVSFSKAAAPTQNPFVNFGAGDFIDVTDLAFPTSGGLTTASSIVAESENDYLATFTEGGVSVELTFQSPTPLTDSSFKLLSDGVGGTDIAACYACGTHIRTDRGEVEIENLRLTDQVLTAGGALRPVKWIGRRALDIARHPDPIAVRPVIVRAGAFGDGVPHRDLWLSPGHNIASEGALIPISCLINGRSVVQVEVDRVEYWHVELDAHDVILAEGLPAESYLDTGNRTAFANGGAFVEANPDFAPRHWADACLPIALEGPAVAATKARLLMRLAETGCDVTQDADPHVCVDGLRVEPIRLSETKLAFALSTGGREISLRSRKFVPAHTVAHRCDLRSLGLCVSSLQIDGSKVALADDEVCASGWHKAEFSNTAFTHRWTTGAARLQPGARIVIVELAGLGYYWRETRDKTVALTA